MSNKWWDDNLKCTYDDRLTCLEVGLCENCEYFPKNRLRDIKSSQLDSKQITIEEFLNDKE